MGRNPGGALCGPRLLCFVYLTSGTLAASPEAESLGSHSPQGNAPSEVTPAAAWGPRAEAAGGRRRGTSISASGADLTVRSRGLG